MTDPLAVRTALQGCDAVVHAAAEIGVSGGVVPQRDTNIRGVRTVIGAAQDVGVGSIVYTSTVSSYLPSTDAVITLATPLAEPLSAYAASKRAAEVVVREWQADGVPIADFTIGGVYGPVSPHYDGSFAAITAALETMMLVPDGGLGVIDVRDLAHALAHAVEGPNEPRRYIAGGRFLSWADWTSTLGEAAGRPVASQAITIAEMVELGRRFDQMRRDGQDVMPLSEEAAIIMTSGVPTDDTSTLSLLGRDYRPTVETFADTIRWLRSVGGLAA
jgi:nucleoside-diphosphate-sugar epimerase